jgi:hypothetical protein
VGLIRDPPDDRWRCAKCFGAGDGLVTALALARSIHQDRLVRGLPVDCCTPVAGSSLSEAAQRTKPDTVRQRSARTALARALPEWATFALRLSDDGCDLPRTSLVAPAGDLGLAVKYPVYREDPSKGDTQQTGTPTLPAIARLCSEPDRVSAPHRLSAPIPVDRRCRLAGRFTRSAAPRSRTPA